MRLIKTASLCVMAVLFPMHASSARADQYTDNLARRLVSSTTQAQRTVFIQWLFSVMALHPSVAPMAMITPAQRQALDKKTAHLFTRLIAVSCKKEAQTAVMFDGLAAIQSAFSVLGKSAMMGLMTNPEVAQGITELQKYIDQQKITQALEPSSPGAGASASGQ